MNTTRREFIRSLAAVAAVPISSPTNGQKIADAARRQIGVTTRYEPRYASIAYPNGDVPRGEGICADVVVRACRDALSHDLQKLVHEDMVANFADYPKKWGARRPDANIDHRRVLNLEVFWQRKGASLWTPNRRTAGDEFPVRLATGDFITWLISGHLPHVGVIVAGPSGPTVIHNIGNGAEETELSAFHDHPAHGHFRWPTA